LAVNGDDVPAVLAGNAALIEHVQIADAPGRGEPGTGDLPLDDWLSRLERAGYPGWVGLEYKSEAADPMAVDTDIGLGAGATLWPNPMSSPWTRRWPQHGFSAAGRSTNVRTSAGVGGRPPRCLG
jgi:hypothetical protein